MCLDLEKKIFEARSQVCSINSCLLMSFSVKVVAKFLVMVQNIMQPRPQISSLAEKAP